MVNAIARVISISIPIVPRKALFFLLFYLAMDISRSAAVQPSDINCVVGLVKHTFDEAILANILCHDSICVDECDQASVNLER